MKGENPLPREGIFMSYLSEVKNQSSINFSMLNSVEVVVDALKLPCFTNHLGFSLAVNFEHLSHVLAGSNN